MDLVGQPGTKEYEEAFTEEIRLPTGLCQEVIERGVVLVERIRTEGPDDIADSVSPEVQDPADDQGDEVVVAIGLETNGELVEEKFERMRQSRDT